MKSKYSAAHVISILLIVLATSAKAGVSPALLEANLGILPVDIYTTPQYSDIFPGASCHTVGGATPQACVQQILAAWSAQGVTGVRFQFALGNGQWQATSGGTFYSSYSTPFTATGGLNPEWNSNLAAFLSDLHAAGMSNVTVYPVLSWYWSGWNNSTFETYSPAYDGCIEENQYYYFYPWLPFGLGASGFFPAGWPDQDINNAYNCSPANPTFWGWTPYFNLVGEIAEDVRSAGLNLEEFEIESEVNFWDFTATARLVYDNTTNTAVRTSVGNILASHGFSAGAATYSTGAANPSVPAFDCGSFYGDSATIVMSSELLAALGGAVIGGPDGAVGTNSLPCGGSVSGTQITIPAQSIYGVVDNHVYPCIGDCGTSPDVTSTAEEIYSGIYWFFYYRGLGGARATIGETSSNSPPGYGCDSSNIAEAYQNANGFLSSGLYAWYASLVTVRPWNWITSVSPELCRSPGNIGSPSGPYAP